MAVLTLLRRNDVRLFLTSATLLFVELLLIRWIPASILYVGFFANFLLMASFLGIGLGILLGRRGKSLPLWPFALLLLGVVYVVTRNELNVRVNSTDELFFGLTDASRAADTNYVVLPIVVGLVAAVMAALAVPLGPLLRSMRPLRAYALDIGGSLAGIAGFTLLSAAGTSPVVWFSVVAVLFVLLSLGQPFGGAATISRAWRVITVATGVLAIAVVVFIVVRHEQPGEIWSPYYRIDHFPASIGEQINVNGIPHQNMHAVDAPKEEFYTRSTAGSRGAPTTTCSSSAPAAAQTPRSRWHAVRSTSTRSRSTRRSLRWASRCTPTTRTRIRVSRLTSTTGAPSCAAPKRSTTWSSSRCPTRSPWSAPTPTSGSSRSCSPTSRSPRFATTSRPTACSCSTTTTGSRG